MAKCPATVTPLRDNSLYDLSFQKIVLKNNNVHCVEKWFIWLVTVFGDSVGNKDGEF